jgi:drug/metabolite transporter (DMT)-like permease
MLSSNQIGAIYMAISALSFSIMDVLVKFMSSIYPTGEIIFFRGFFGLIPIIFIIPRDRYKNFFQTTKLKLHLTRAIVGAIAMIGIYLGVKFLPLADAITITFAAPVFATIFSMIILKEQVRMYRWAAIIIGLIGVTVVLKPGTDMFSVYSLFPILFCVGFGIIAVLIKKLSETEPDYLIAIYFTLTLITVGACSLFFQFVLPKFQDLLPLVAIGIAGSTGNIFLTMSLRKGSVSTVTPIKYLSLVFATVSGIFFFNEIPHISTLFGAFLIILSSVIIFKREQIKNVKPVITRQI